MRLNQWLILLAGVIIFIASCKKDDDMTGTPASILIDESTNRYYQSDGEVQPEDKVVLIQEFTGVNCYTCPLAHDIVANLNSLYPNRLAIMNVHSYLYSIYSEPLVLGNQYDFRTYDADTIVTMLGGVESVPSAAVDMKLMNGEERIISFNRGQWADYVAEAFNEPVPVNIDLATKFDEENRNLKIVTKFQFVEDRSQSIFFSIGLVENNIIDLQKVDTEVDSTYSHQHILRDMIGNTKGNHLSDSPKERDTYIKVFNVEVPSDWKPENLEVIAYTHLQDTAWDVLQAKVVKVEN